MTKSRQSAIRLRLSRLVRCLLALGCLKLAIMGWALLDLPMPAWFQSSPQPANVALAGEETGPEYSAPATTEAIEAINESEDPEAFPQGASAAELAAAAKPRKRDYGQAALPTPLVPAGPSGALSSEGNAFVAPLLPEPPALDAPLARAGVVVPEPTTPNAVALKEESIWDALNLKSLPIPGLGSAQVAQAASLDMPVPQTPAQRSPFAPAEQVAPLGNNGRTLPGAPPLPANIPGSAGQADPALQGGAGLLPEMPQATQANLAPAPTIPQRQSFMDHNTKSQELARQQQDMLMLRQQMDQRLKELQSAEDKMKDVLREAKDTEEKKVKSLVQMYANMKPRMAAQALENMDERIAVRILSGMAPKQSGEILTYTNPAKTAKFTEMITRLRLGE